MVGSNLEDLKKRPNSRLDRSLPVRLIACAPGRARVAQATYDQLWWLIVDLEVQVLYGP